MNQTANCGIAESSDNDLYDLYVTKLADSQSSELISNGQIEHAQSLIRNLFSHAEQEVRIFTSNLLPAIYCDTRVVEAATTFLAKTGAKLNILIQNGDRVDRSMPFFKLCSGNSELCEMKEVAIDADKAIQQHMIVMDATGYRFCADADKDKNEAIASFNDQETAKNLAEQFDILFNRAKSYEAELETAG